MRSPRLVSPGARCPGGAGCFFVAAADRGQTITPDFRTRIRTAGRIIDTESMRRTLFIGSATCGRCWQASEGPRDAPFPLNAANRHGPAKRLYVGYKRYQDRQTGGLFARKTSEKSLAIQLGCAEFLASRQNNPGKNRMPPFCSPSFSADFWGQSPDFSRKETIYIANLSRGRPKDPALRPSEQVILSSEIRGSRPSSASCLTPSKS